MQITRDKEGGHNDMPDQQSTAYQADKVDYLTQITRLFGGYKRRAIEFMNLQPGVSILDAGCGTGDDLIAIGKQLGPAVQLTGVELLPELVTEARKRAEAAGVPVTFHEGDLYQLPLETDTIDRARTDRVFQHLEQPAEALAELIRVTKPGGWVVVAEVDWGTLVLDHPMVELTDKIAAFYRDRQPNGRAGRGLYRLFKKSPLTQVEVYADAVCITDWTIARFIWGIDAMLNKVASAGLISPEDSAQWLQRGQESASAGTFCGSMTGFIVRGQVAKA